MEVISVFYSGTEDAIMTRYKKVFDACATQVGRLLDVHLNVLYWREMAGGLADSAQVLIDDRVAGGYQIYFGVMGTRFGKGTAHEYGKAVQDHISKGKPNFVCFGFCEEPVNPYEIDPDSLADLIQFRKDIGNGKHGKAMLYFTFADESAFQRRIEDHLKEAIKVVKDRVSGGRRFGSDQGDLSGSDR